MLVNFGSKSGKKEVFFSILIEDPLMRELEGSTGISKEDKEAPSIFKRIVLDSHQYIGEDQKDIHITVTGLDDNNVCYTIAEEDEGGVHEVALKCLNIQEAIDGVANHRIVTVAQLIKKVGAESVLEHFAEIRRRSPGLFSRMMEAIGQFFSCLLLRFRFIEFLWEAITHDSKKKEARMRWDLDLLSATCGIAPDRELSVTDSLDYMSQMLKREETAPIDPAVSKRVSEGADLGKHLNQLRKKFSRKRFKKVRSRVCEKAAKLDEGEKMLLPVSYLKKGNSVQMLMEIGKSETGKYTVALISHSEETRELFDRELGLETSQSPRREIENVELNDLLAMLSVVIELDTAPQCRSEAPTSDWESVFMQALKMPDTHVRSVEMTSSYESGLSSSHVGETLEYLARQQKTPEEAKRFELAARLRIFLDLTGRGEKQFKDSRYWRLVRTCAHQLARMIESNKSVIGDAESRPIELARIFSELQQMLDNLDTHLPELVNLRKQIAPRLSGLIEVKGEPPPPPLENVEKKRNVYPKIHPAFEPLNPEDPVQSIIDWGHRIRTLIDLGEINLAGNEAPLMARMLPKPEELSDLSGEQLQDILEGLNVLTEAIARSVVSEGSSSIYLQTTVEALHCYSVSLIKDKPEFSEVREIYPHISSLEELLKTRMPPPDRVWLEGIAKPVPYRDSGYPTILYGSSNFDLAPKHLSQPVFNIIQLARIAREELTVNNMPQEAVNFRFKSGGGISAFPEMVLTTEPDSVIPLSLKPPSYAQVVGEELTNRYTSEFCCLGCIRDNCPSYNKVDKKDMRFHPLFMLHNYVDIFCENLIKTCRLHRDEAVDLLYTQQTNQNANNIWVSTHNRQHATKAATGFDPEDHRIQAINTLNVFLENPHFFRHPELCWQFETRLFTSDAFLELMKSSGAFLEHQPFLMGALRRLNREISVSYAGGDLTTAAYLLHTSERIKAMIKNSDTIHETEKSALLGLFKHDADTLLLTWGGELVGKEDEKAQEDMRMVLPLLAGRFHTRFIDSSGKDPCFLDKKILQTLFLSLARIENLQKGKEKIDPEIYVRYKGLAAALVPQVEKVIEEESSKGDFINSILAVLHPGIAAKRLEWDTAELPTVLALDPVTKELYAYDLTTGQLTLQEKSRVELPPFLRINPDVKRLFGHAVESEWQTRRTPADKDGEKVDEYIHPDFPDLRILVKFPIRKEGEEAVPKRRVVIERKIKISSRRHAWMSYKRFNEQNSVVNGGKRSETPDIPCIAAQLIGNRQCWVDRDGKKIYVLDFETGDTYAIISMKRVLEKEEDPTTGKTVKVDKGEAMIKDFYLVEQDAHLLSPDKKAMERFTLLDDPRFIVVSGKRSHPDTVEFSRYQLAASEAPLVYTVGKKSITTSLFPDFELAPYGIWPGSRDPALGAQPLPPTFDVFHLLRTEGEERVLVPFCQSKQEISVSGNPLRTSLPVFSESYDKIPVYEYKVDPETNRLVAQSGDAYAYLAYICLTHSDYASAAFYLDRAKTSAGYSERYDQIFEWFEKWDDDSPNGVALKLRFELLRENVFIERAARAIAEGSSKSLGEANLEEVNRLISLAELFAKYKEHSDAVEMGEDGRSPALDLTPEQEEDLARYVRQLIDTHGEEPVKTDEPRPVSAQMAPLQEFMLRDEKHNALNISNGAMALWLFKGSGKHKTPLVVHDPTWVLRDFRDTFNKLLEREPNSVEFKGLVNKLRMISEFTPEELDPVVKKQVEAAQAYLLKLASAKMNDAVFITQLKETVLAESLGRFPEIQGPWFFNRRSNFLNLLNSMTRGEKTHFDQFSLASKDRSRTKALGIYHDHDRSSAERKIAKRAIRFLNRPDLPDDGPEFNQAFRSFLLEEILGGSGARSLLKIDEILGELEEYEIEQPQQTQELPKLKPKPPEQTYREKYGPLLESLEHYVDHTKIESMEALISKRSEPPKLARITTPDTEKKAIFQDRLDEYEEMFTVSEKKPATVSESIFDGLASSEIKAYQRMAEEHRSDLHAHLEGTVHAVDISWSDAEKLHEELEQQLLLEKSEKEHLRRRLLQYVEHFEKPVGTLALKRLTGAEVKPSLEVLIALWRQNEIMQEWSENPLKGLGLKEMTPQVIEGLDEMISQYMQLDAKTRHLERTVDVCAGYLESCAAPPEGAGEPQLARELWEALQTRRHFNLNDADARDLLFLEYSLGIILRPQQVETLRDMLSDPNAVRQLIMGGGKSKVLLPMLAKRKANGKNLVMLMLPEELYEANCRDLDATNRLLFRQGMHRFDFSRHSERSEESLLKTYGMLLETVRDRGYVMTTKRSVLSFKNAYIELLYKLQRLPDEDEELPKLIAEVRAMSKILKLFQAQTDVIADEVDACLDVRKEVNFSLGDPEPVDPIKGDTGAELMSIILEAKPGGPLFKLRENLLRNTQAAISPEERKIMLRHLASAFYEKHRVELINFEKDLFIDYLMDSAADREIQDKVLSMKGSEKEGDVVLYRQITTVKAYLDRGFGTALGRIGNVNYGRDPVSGIWTIPYKASNSPHIGSEFDDDIERLTFTYQDYLQNGVEYKQVYQSVARMLKEAQNEMRSREEEELITLNETAGGKEFQEFLKKVDPTEKLGALTLSQAAHPKRIEAIVAAVNATPEGRLAFCHTQVIENIKQYDAQIHSNSQDLVEMVRSFGGFTGTPWNRYTYHDKIDAQKSLGVDGQTWELMLGRDVPVRSFAFDADRPIESLVMGLEVVGNYQAVIDTGAYLRGVDNDEFIDYCLDVAEEDGIEMGGGIYFDRSGKIVKKCGLDEKSLPIEIASETEKMSNITLYDQGHTVGADIKQGKTATAIVTIGENTFIRDLFQAVWRLRQLHQEQRVELAISDEIKFRILAEKPEERDSDIITSEDILRFCLQNEARREAEDNYRAEKEKIQGVAKRHGFNEVVAIAEADTDEGKIIALARELATPDAGFFIKTRPKEKAYEEYGRLKILEDPVEVLARLKGVAADRCLLLSAKLESISLEASERSKQKGVEVTAREDRPVDWVPEDVDGSVDSVGGEVEQEAQAEVENTLELMLETETVKEVEVASEVVIPMVKSGAAGHGDVYPLELGSINHAVDGSQAGDRLRRLRNGSPYFDEDIFLSAVFERNLPSVPQPFTLPRSLFYSNRKSVKNVLIVKKEGRWTMIIPTMHEAHHSCREFIGGADEGTQAVEVAISKSRPQIVYKTGEERTEELPFEDLEDRAQFYRLYVQAKLFNGEIVYETAEEIEALKAWLKEVDVAQFAEYFQNYILSAKPRRFADEYPKSSLYRIIHEVSSELITV